MVITKKLSLQAVCCLFMLFLFVFISSVYAMDLTSEENEYLRTKGTIVFVSQTRYPPFEFVDQNGQHEGMMLDVVRWMAVEMGFKPVFIDMTFQQAQEAVLSGKADMLTSLFYSEKRREKFEFTETLFDVPASIFVKVERTDIKDLNNLNGKTIAIQRGDYAKDFLESKSVRFDTLSTEDFDQATDMVISGKADAVIGDEQIVLYHIFGSRLTEYVKKMGEPLYIGKNCMASNKSNAILIGILNKGIHEARQSGVLDKIGKKWLGTKYGPRETFVERYLFPLSAVAGGLLLLSLGAWVWNVRLHALVRRKTEVIVHREGALRESQEALSKSHRELQETVQQLEQSMNMLQLIIESIPIRVFWKDRDLRYSGCNTLFARDAGLSHPEQLLGLDDFAMGWREQAEFYRKDDRQVMESGLPQMNIAEPQTTPAGSKIWLNTSKVPLYLPGGEVFGVLGVYEDITERRQTAEALSLRESYLTAIIENQPGLLWLKDTESRFLAVNHAFVSSCGRQRPEEITGKTDLDVWPRELAEKYRGDDSEVMTSRTPIVVEERILDQGVPKWFQTFKTPVFTTDGQVLGTCGFALDITERKLAAEALRESKDLYRSLVDASPDAISVTDTDGLLTFASPRALQIFGYSPDEDVIGRSVLDWVSPEERERALNVLGLILTEGVPKSGEYTLIKKDGTAFVGEVSGAIFNSPDGNPKGMLLITRDITERKQAEEALRESEERFRQLAENINQVFWIANRDMTETLYVSPAYEEIWGRTTTSLYANPKSWLDSVHPEDLYLLTNSLAKRASGSRALEYRIVRPDGSIRWIIDRGFPVRDGTGETYRFAGIAEDITERKAAEQVVRASEAKFRSYIESAPLAIFVADREGRLVDFNPAATHLLGYDAATMKKMHILDIHPDEDREEILSEIATLLEDGHVETECRMKKCDGQLVWVLLHAVMVSDQVLLGYCQDVTERKRGEEERRRLDDRLQRAEKMEALGTMAGGVAHDLNNILGIVIGYSELLLNVDVPSSAKSHVMEILKAGKRASTIVQDLLTLTRRGVPNRQVLNLNNIVIECQKSPEFTNLFSYHPAVQVKTELEADLLNLLGSSVHVEKTFMNLISNAAEAMHNGGVITVKTENQYLDKPVSGYDEVKDGDYIVLSVSDTGEGIPAADLKRIFEPFYTKKVMGRSGTGLGLTVVWGTVKDHQGYINVESREGKGTTFTLYFPVTREELSREEVAVAAYEYMGNGEAILVVDDVKEQRELASIILKKLNYDVVSVSCGEEAVEYLKEHNVDLVVLDMIMDPGMDGLDTYAKILEIHSHQKAIIVSGFSETERVSKAQALGAGAYVKKPYLLEKLGLAVRKEIDKRA